MPQPIEFHYIETPSDCTNSGPCCYSCPVFDDCDHHYEGDEP